MTDTSLGDFARCLVRLHPLDEVQVAAVARLLGFDYEAPGAATGPAPRPAAGSEPRLATSGPRPRTVQGPGPAGDEVLRPRLTPIARREPTAIARPEDAIRPLRRYDSEIHGARLPHEPLWDPRWTRELVAAAAATPTVGHDVDVEQLVDALARGRALVAIPRRRTRTLGLGVQVLADLGPAMDPFARDRDGLVDTIRETVGRRRTSVLRFSGSPRRAGPRGRASWEAYRGPDPGTPVLALTDLGIGMAAADVHGEWLELAERLRLRGSRLVALVPYPPSRWPRQLSVRMVIVHWDRPTTVASVLRRVDP